MNVIGIIYIQPLSHIIMLCIIAVPAWALLTCMVRKSLGVKAYVWLNRVLVVGEIVAIIYCTLLDRKALARRMVELRPLYSFVNAKIQPEIYRTLIMNMLLFIPFGMTFPFALSNRFINRVAITIVSAAVMSILIEFAQFCFRLGLCETDDVIMNTLGAVLGTISYVLYEKFNNNGVRR